MLYVIDFSPVVVGRGQVPLPGCFLIFHRRKEVPKESTFSPCTSRTLDFLGFRWKMALLPIEYIYYFLYYVGAEETY